MVDFLTGNSQLDLGGMIRIHRFFIFFDIVKLPCIYAVQLTEMKMAVMQDTYCGKSRNLIAADDSMHWWRFALSAF